MPELPEVETVRRSLVPYLPGRAVEEVLVHHPKVLVFPDPVTFRQQLRGARFEQLDRRGKLLIFRLPPWVLLIHLGMTGQLTFRDPTRADQPFSRHPATGLQRTTQHEVDKHTHISLLFGDGCAVHYRDIRKFGKWRLFAHDHPGLPGELARVGPDPLTPEWQFEHFAEAVRGSRRAVKALLLDQGVAAGVGNIYADEALFVAGIRPSVPGAKLSRRRVERLFAAVPAVLNKGLAYGGTSFSDYVDADGKKGSHQEQLLVYGRYGQPCSVCQAPLQRTTVAQRTSTWCKVCQRP
jgi:formamidopyrimidine-DNA glycosylase